MKGVFLLLGATVYQRHSPSAKHTRLPPHPFKPWLNPVIRLLGSHMPVGHPLPGIPTPCPWLSPSSSAVTSSTPPWPTLIEDLASCHQHTAAARREHLCPPPTCALPVTRALPPPVPPSIPVAPSFKGQPAPQLSPDPTATCPTSSLCPQSRTPHTCSLPVLWLTFDSLRAAFCPHTLLTGPSKVSNALHHLPWPCPIGRQRRGTRPHSWALRGARPSRPIPLGGSWPSPAGPADPPLPGSAVNGRATCPRLSQHRRPCLQPAPHLASTPPEHEVVLRPQDPPRGLWGGLSGERPASASSHLPRIRPVTAMLWAPSARAVVRRKPAPQRGQKNVCGARPQFQTTRTFLRPHPPKKPFPQKHLPCSKRPLLPAPHAPCVQEGESAGMAKERQRACWALGPWARCPKEEDFSGALSAPNRFL